MTLGFRIVAATVAFCVLFLFVFIGAAVLQAVFSVFGVRL